MSLYMHTIDGQPAVMADTGYICFAGRSVSRLATSLTQIRAEQNAVMERDAREGNAGKWKYGYARIPVSTALKALEKIGIL